MYGAFAPLSWRARTAVRPHDGRGASAPWYLVLSDQLLEGPCARAPLTARPREPTKARFWAPIWPRARALVMGRLCNEPCTFKPNLLSFSLILTSISLFFSNSLNSKTHIFTHHHSHIAFVCETRLLRIAKIDQKRKSEDAKRKGKLAMPPTRKSPRLAGFLPFAPPASPKSVLRPNKLMVLAIADARGEPNLKAQASAQATVEKPPADVKGKKAARISVKALRKRFSQRIIARGGPSRPKPKKAVVIDLVSYKEEEARGKEIAAEEPPLVAAQAGEKEEEEDPEEYPPPCSPLPPFPPSPELGPRGYDDPHYWNFDRDLDLVGGEPAAAHDWDSAEEEEEEEDCSTSSDSTN
ncbi:hypothetical protein PIB30_094140 [Stylosanthes scabra]|uniref:Uncharacterized protein n=1 Tax=Stylosanthes scabra TaxID=79078 RepID=A0ABU6VWH2_9FABA|nr:hypothetical protein [Stylosanthes scabra]